MHRGPVRQFSSYSFFPVDVENPQSTITRYSAQAVQSKYADANGVRLHYLIAGKGEPILLLHGYAQTSHMWRPLMAKLAATNTVIAPDLRGFGGSAAPADGYNRLRWRATFTR